MEGWWQDLRFAVRSLRRRRAITLLALLTMALSIGANTAIWSVVQGVLLAPLPFPHPEEIVAFFEEAPKLDMVKMNCSPLDFDDWRTRSRSFSSLAAYHRRSATLTGSGEPVALAAAEVSGDFFRALGERPLAGRFLAAEDDRPGAEKTVVLGARLWHQRFAGDPGVLGRRITLDGASYAVIGIAPSSLDYPAESDLWVPLALDLAKERRGAHYLGVLGRLAPGVSLLQARSEMAAISAALARQFPADDADWSAVLSRLQDLLVEEIRPALVMLQLAVWMILLIGCVNVANLLLARMASRRGEIAVRRALGAGRWRLARQIGAEGMVLACGGGALGLLVALWGTPLLVALYPSVVPHREAIGLHAPVLLYALLVSLATGAACGLLPALAATGGALDGTLRSGGRSVAGERRGRTTRGALVQAQVALALTLLVGAGLLIESFARLQAVDLGFVAQGAITAHVTLPAARYPDPVRKIEFYRRLVQAVGALPGVEHAAAIDALPLLSGGQVVDVAAEGAQRDRAGDSHAGGGSLVTPDYFRAMRIPLLAGRVLGEHDDLKSPQVVVVSRLAAARLRPGQDPLGRRLTFGKVPDRPDSEWWTVVGVAGDVRDTDPATEPEIQVYISQFQLPPGRATLVARANGDPRRLVGAIRQAVWKIDPNLALDRVQTLDEVVAASFGGTRVKTVLLAIFAALALGLAAVGAYGMISQSVEERLREISIRMALGAQREQVVSLIVRQGMVHVAAGLAVGLLGAWAFGRLLAGQLFKVGATDAATYGGLLLLLAAVALLATWLPARRASRADPVDALRHE